MKRLSGVIAAGALCALPAAAQVSTTDSVSFTVPLPEVQVNFFLFSGEFGDTSTTPITGLPQFDPALGTLVDVRISFDYLLEVDAFIESQGILNPGVPHFASWSPAQLAHGVTFFRNIVDPPDFLLIGDIISSFGVGCQGNPGDGDACSDSNFDIFGFGAFDVSLADDIVLDDFIGLGTYDGLFFEFDVLDSSWQLDNVSEAFVDVNGFLDPSMSSITIEYFYATDEPDADGDGVADVDDNCIDAPNPSQLDADGDNYGNACDADINNDCVVNAIDLGNLKAGFFGSDPLLDFNGDGVVNAIDLGQMKVSFFGVPGPSGLTSVCTEPSRAASEPAGLIFDAGSRRYVER